MIDPNRQYRTRDGRAVRIYATDGGCDEREIHGAVEVNGGWEAVVWLPSGRARFSGSNFNSHDLIEVTLADELRDQIPWSALRPEIRWVAMEQDQVWTGFVEKPNAVRRMYKDVDPGKGVGGWNSMSTEFGLSALSMPEVDPARWRETLVERPEDEP